MMCIHLGTDMLHSQQKEIVNVNDSLLGYELEIKRKILQSEA